MPTYLRICRYNPHAVHKVNNAYILIQMVVATMPMENPARTINARELLFFLKIISPISPNNHKTPAMAAKLITHPCHGEISPLKREVIKCRHIK